MKVWHKIDANAPVLCVSHAFENEAKAVITGLNSTKVRYPYTDPGGGVTVYRRIFGASGPKLDALEKALPKRPKSDGYVELGTFNAALKKGVIKEEDFAPEEPS